MVRVRSPAAMAHLERDLFTIRRVLKAKKVHCTVRLTLSVSLAITILEASRQSVALNTQRPPRTGNHESRGVADGRHAGIHAKKSGIEGFSSADLFDRAVRLKTITDSPVEFSEPPYIAPHAALVHAR